MELSSRLEYAFLALLELSDHQADAHPLKVCQIAAAQSIPSRYLDQILISLRQSGLVQSQRGVRGGYVLAKEPRQITLLEIAEAVESESDEDESNGFPEGVNSTSTVEKKVVLATWKQASQGFREVLGSYTLQDLRLQRHTNQPLQLHRGSCPLNRGACPHC